jgi:peptidoglycan/LPS O-acetylase OafA/YrhL
MTDDAGRPPIPARVGALDGLRGWAALSVVIYHMTWELFGLRFPEFRTPLVSVIGNGSLAVAIFFCISGYVLTVNRWRRTAHLGLWPLLIKRYLRLTIPIAAAVLLVWALMAVDKTPAATAAAFVNRNNWLADFADFTPNLGRAIGFAFAGVYFTFDDRSYGPFLWTMIVELWGSILILSLSQTERLFRESYSPLVFIIALSLAFGPLGSLPACFFAGALLALLQRDGLVFHTAAGPRESLFATIAIPAILVGAAVAHQLAPDGLFSASVLGVGLFICVMRSNAAQAFLTLPLSRFFGRLSFPLYLMQYIILISPVSLLVIALGTAGYLDQWTAVAIAAAGVVLTVGAATAFFPVERFTLALGNWLTAKSVGVRGTHGR